MIRIKLPNLFSNYSLNLELISIFNQHSNWFYDNVVISDIAGNFNWCIASGENFSNIKSEQPNYDLINRFISEYVHAAVNIDFDFSNHLYTGHYDNYCDIILKAYDSGSNRIEISNTDLIDILHKEYPNYHFVISENANISSIEKLNELLQHPLIDIIYIDRNLINSIIEYNIPAHKVGLIINPMCPLNCSKLLECKQCQNQYNYSYSEKNIYNNCEQRLNLLNNYQIYSIDYIINNLYSRGFHWFKFSTFSNIYSKEDCAQFLTHYLVKPEYVNEIIKILKNGGII